jgi:hypothetical protein
MIKRVPLPLVAGRSVKRIVTGTERSEAKAGKKERKLGEGLIRRLAAQGGLEWAIRTFELEENRLSQCSL